MNERTRYLFIKVCKWFTKIFFHTLIISIAVWVCFSPILETSANGSIQLYIAPTGNDNNSGDLEAPLGSLEGARDKIRRNGWAGRQPVVVNLREGIYSMARSFMLTHEDSGSPDAPICYRSYPGERAVISGGIQLNEVISDKAWEALSEGSPVQTIDVTKILEDYGPFKSLYVNGKRANRARSPNAGYYLIKSVDEADKKNAFRFNIGDIHGNWQDLKNVEVVTYQNWYQTRYKINEVEEDKVFFNGEFSKGYDWEEYKWQDGQSHARYYVENSYECLDSPGEWYLDVTRKKLYYWPLEEEANMADTKCIVPVVRQPGQPLGKELVNLTGSVEAPVHDIQFLDLDFAHNDWDFLLKGYYAAGLEGHRYGAGIWLHYTRNIRIENNRFYLLGGNAVSSEFGHQLIIRRNTMRDLGGGGVYITAASAWNTDSSNNSVTDNTIHDINAVYKNSAAIYDGYGVHEAISHNEIWNTSYSGIIFIPGFFSFGMHPEIDPATVDPNSLTRSRIEYNHIHHAVQELNDGAGIYTSGPYTESWPGYDLGYYYGVDIGNNYIHAIDKTDNHTFDKLLMGIYIDERSYDMQVYNNIVSTADVLIFLHRTRKISVYNNIFYGASTVLMSYQGYEIHCPDNLEDAEGNSITRNIFYSTGGVLYPYPNANFPSKIKLSDYNLYFKPSLSCPNRSWWKSAGYDGNSIEADPQFRDPEAKNFELMPASAALRSVSQGGISFAPIDLGMVGPRYLLGDISGDGSITAHDAALASKIGPQGNYTANELKRGDVNADAKIDAEDAVLIAKRAVGLIDKFPVEGG